MGSHVFLSLVHSLFNKKARVIGVYGVEADEECARVAQGIVQVLSSEYALSPVVFDSNHMTGGADAETFWSKCNVHLVSPEEMPKSSDKTDWLQAKWPKKWVVVQGGDIINPTWEKGRQAVFDAPEFSLVLVVKKGKTLSYRCKQAISRLQSQGHTIDSIVLFDCDEPLLETIVEDIHAIPLVGDGLKQRFCHWVENNLNFLSSIH